MTPNTLGISIPKLADPKAFNHYQTSLKTPQKYGMPTRTSPTVSDQESEGDFIISHFNDLQGQGISAQFGQSQIFKIDLIYKLTNEGQSAGVAQIALPPDTSWQKLNYLDIQPRPQNIQADADGNWIASFLIQAEKELEVTATATVKLTLDQNPEVPIIKPLPGHLKSLSYWESDNSKIKDLANQQQSAVDLYNYVITSLEYGYPNAETVPVRKGAVQALIEPDQAVCQEFTDLFIALSRAKKIPARRLTGFAYTKNNKLKPSSLVDNVLHAWPEFFNTSMGNWQQVDPTWEETTGGADYFHQFDLNHITFAINGVSSVSPAPAGLNDTQQKEVKVTFAQTFESTPVKEQLELSLNPKKISGIPVPGLLELSVHNLTGRAIYQLQPNLNSSNYWLKTTDSLNLLPFQTGQWTIYIKPSCWFACSDDDLQLQVNGQNYQLKLSSTTQVWIIPGVIALAFIGIVVALLTGSVLVFKRKR
jgi:hypothetical protein